MVNKIHLEDKSSSSELTSKWSRLETVAVASVTLAAGFFVCQRNHKLIRFHIWERGMPSIEKVSAKKLPESLTKDSEVISSMKAIQRAGFWAFVIAAITPIILFMSLSGGGEPTSSVITFPIIALYLGYSGWKLNRLEGHVVAMLVVNIVLGLLLITGIFPILLVVMSIIALVKISPYSKWYETNNIKTLHIDRKSIGPNTLEQDQTRRLVKVVFAVLAILAVTGTYGGAYASEKQKCMDYINFYSCRTSDPYGVAFGAGIAMLVFVALLYFFVLPAIYKYIQYGNKSVIKSNKQ